MKWIRVEDNVITEIWECDKAPVKGAVSIDREDVALGRQFKNGKTAGPPYFCRVTPDRASIKTDGEESVILAFEVENERPSETISIRVNGSQVPVELVDGKGEIALSTYNPLGLHIRADRKYLIFRSINIKPAREVKQTGEGKYLL